jgi:hypothetical protein
MDYGEKHNTECSVNSVRSGREELRSSTGKNVYAKGWNGRWKVNNNCNWQRL